jgi:putative membrane protein insertion efficiency factor
MIKQGYFHRDTVYADSEPFAAAETAQAVKKAAAKALIAVIKGYRAIVSPMFPPTCRFTPTCSEYFIQALEKYGIFKGSWLGIRRILRCHPFSPGGYDPLV